MPKKRGRPRKFHEKDFLKLMQAGLSKEEACQRINISKNTFDYYFYKNRAFQEEVRRLSFERKMKEFPEKFKLKYNCSPEEYLKKEINKHPKLIISPDRSFDENLNAYLKIMAISHPNWRSAVGRIRRWLRESNLQKRKIFWAAFRGFFFDKEPPELGCLELIFKNIEDLYHEEWILNHAFDEKARLFTIEGDEPFCGEVAELEGVRATGRTESECRNNLIIIFNRYVRSKLEDTDGSLESGIKAYKQINSQLNIKDF